MDRGKADSRSLELEDFVTHDPTFLSAQSSNGTALIIAQHCLQIGQGSDGLITQSQG